MNYIDLDKYPRKWIFNHKDVPLSQQQLKEIKPLDGYSSCQIWQQLVSKKSTHGDFFSKGDWACNKALWQSEVEWQNAWDSESPELPSEVLSFISWPDNTKVFFCYEKYNVVETTWGGFKQSWKNFLFFDEGPVLVSQKKNQALWFHQQGKVVLSHHNK